MESEEKCSCAPKRRHGGQRGKMVVGGPEEWALCRAKTQVQRVPLNWAGQVLALSGLVNAARQRKTPDEKRRGRRHYAGALWRWPRPRRRRGLEARD